jgi:hypothetical protein
MTCRFEVDQLELQNSKNRLGSRAVAVARARREGKAEYKYYVSVSPAMKIYVEKKRYDNQVGILTWPAFVRLPGDRSYYNNAGKYLLYASIF